MKAKLVIITARKLALAPRFHGELDDEDAILGRERDQHDESDLGIEIVGEARELEGQE